MKHIFEYWREQNSRKEGYTVADVVFYAEADDESFCGKKRQTRQAAINDGIRVFKKTGAGVSIYARAEITYFYNDGTMKRKAQMPDEVRLGSIYESGFFDLCEQVDWLD